MKTKIKENVMGGIMILLIGLLAFNQNQFQDMISTQNDESAVNNYYNNYYNTTNEYYNQTDNVFVTNVSNTYLNVTNINNTELLLENNTELTQYYEYIEVSLQKNIIQSIVHLETNNSVIFNYLAIRSDTAGAVDSYYWYGIDGSYSRSKKYATLQGITATYLGYWFIGANIDQNTEILPHMVPEIFDSVNISVYFSENTNLDIIIGWLA